jgi:GNAT superfamily N-acetyltransferase
MSNGTLTLRHDLRPGDLGRVTELHGRLYAEEYGLSPIFEGYVAETLGEFGKRALPDRDRLWLAEIDGRLVGSVGIVGREEGAAQLRWLLVAPEARGRGLGQRLLDDALAFCRATGRTSVYLWTISLLPTAARMYRAAGFRKTAEEGPSWWGREVTEERYDLTLSPASGAGHPLADDGD